MHGAKFLADIVFRPATGRPERSNLLGGEADAITARGLIGCDFLGHIVFFRLSEGSGRGLVSFGLAILEQTQQP